MRLLRTRAATPARPVPSSSIVVGSGIGVCCEVKVTVRLSMPNSTRAPVLVKAANCSVVNGDGLLNEKVPPWVNPPTLPAPWIRITPDVTSVI